MDGLTDRQTHTDVQHETVISCHYLVKGIIALSAATCTCMHYLQQAL